MINSQWKLHNMLSIKKVLTSTLAIVLFSLCCTVSAEIYQCKDANGHATFSNTPCPAVEITGTSTAHKLWREMRVLVKEGEIIYKGIGADVDSIVKCKHKAADYDKQLDKIDSRLQKVSKSTHAKLHKAMEMLRECGRCSASAPAYCERASDYLDQESNVLVKH